MDDGRVLEPDEVLPAVVLALPDGETGVAFRNDYAETDDLGWVSRYDGSTVPITDEAGNKVGEGTIHFIVENEELVMVTELDEAAATALRPKLLAGALNHLSVGPMSFRTDSASAARP